MSFPVQPDELTATWLTENLRQAGVLAPDNAVRDFTAKPIGEGIGLLGLVVRAELEYENEAGAGSRHASSSSSPIPSRRTGRSR